MSQTEADPQDVSYSTLEDETSEPVEVVKAHIGLELAKRLLLLIAFVLALVAVFAFFSFPDTTSRETAEATQQARQMWFDEIKDLLQLLVVSLLVPLLTTLIGYIFGRQAGETQSP